MPSSDAQSAEIAHVLFLDIVGYSRLPHEVKSRLVAELTELVRGTEEFRRAKPDDELLTLPTGDGMALIFFRYLLAPLHGTPLPNAAVFYHLRSGGLLSGNSEHDCRLRCDLYGSYLRHHLL